MGIKIKKLYLKNFKVYNERIFDFTEGGLIVFDGPNGFGKTTIFDAIELLFTGVIRRYIVIRDKLVDGRETRNENPLYNIDGDGSPILLKVQFEYEGVDYFIARKTRGKSELDNQIIFNDFKLYTLDNFEANPDESALQSNEYLVKFLGANFINDFEFLNYIEQEDSFYLLKANEKDKADSISYLFNTERFQEKINKFSNIQTKLKEFEYDFSTKRRELEEEIELIKKESVVEKKVDFMKLFDEIQYEWDSEEIDFDVIPYEQILDVETGELNKIEELLKNRDTFLKSVKNEKLNRILQNKDSLIRLFFYDNFRENDKRLSLEKNLSLEIFALLQNFEELTFQELIEDECDLSDQLKNELELESDPIIIFYELKLSELKRLYQNSSKTEKIYDSVLSSRAILKSHLLEYHANIDGNGVCPLCGYNWEAKEQLLENIENQKIELENLNSELNSNLTELKESFLENEVKNLINLLIDLELGFDYSKEYFSEDFFDEQLKRLDKEMKDGLSSLGIDYSEFTSKNINIPEDDTQQDEFLSFLEGNKEVYIEDFIKSYFKEIYNEYFNRNSSELTTFRVLDLEKKKSYIKYAYSIYLSETLKTKNAELERTKILNSKCSASLKTITDILNSLVETLKWYNNQLIKDIELLFHIYSGRIVQDFYGGLGLFIINKNGRIKFVITPDKTYDAIFSMSNGQLSALIISFTLALNKKYSQNKLLLIDDPVQSMDDMNTAGFVEVLRNDFSKTQIFLSTHEQSMSTYIRYKFKKFNISSNRVDISNE